MLPMLDAIDRLLAGLGLEKSKVHYLLMKDR